MGKKNRFKEHKRREAEQSLSARLEAHSKTAPQVLPVASYAEFEPVYRAAINWHRHAAIRSPEDWRCAIKSRSPERRFLELVKHAFARYPVARHLENAWLGDPFYRLADQVPAPVRPVDGGPGIVDLRGWYILATQGGSLHRQATQAFMSKAETHHFLTTPPEVSESGRAFWYAIARAQGADRHLAQRVSQTRLPGFSVASTFWRDAARFFTRNPIGIAEMNDLIDFFLAARQEDENFALKGRSLEALRRRMKEWHRALRKQQAVCGGAWAGHPLPDVEYEAGAEHRKAIWRFRQIKTGNELFREGQRMHHCVVTYKGRCIAGDISIWSLTSEYPLGKLNRGVTMEVRDDGAIVQCRGFANRLPYGNEVAMVKRWAQDHGLTWRAYPA